MNARWRLPRSVSVTWRPSRLALSPLARVNDSPSSSLQEAPALGLCREPGGSADVDGFYAVVQGDERVVETPTSRLARVIDSPSSSLQEAPALGPSPQAASAPMWMNFYAAVCGDERTPATPAARVIRQHATAHGVSCPPSAPFRYVLSGVAASIATASYFRCLFLPWRMPRTGFATTLRSPVDAVFNPRSFLPGSTSARCSS
jgi:hypothetical protein